MGLSKFPNDSRLGSRYSDLILENNQGHQKMINSEEWRSELMARRTAVWAIAQQHECDLALIFGSFGHAEPFRYLTNFVPVLGDAWGILTAPNGMACVLNFSWQLDEARQISGIQEWYGLFNPVPSVVELLASHAPK